MLAWGALGGAVGVLLLLVLATGRRSAYRAWPRPPFTEAPDLAWVIEGAALARGVTAPKVWRLPSGAPNVACLRGRHRARHVVVSTAAEKGLERDELEALAALQFSLLLDGSTAGIRRSLFAASRAIVWTGRGAFVACVLSAFNSITWLGLTINIAAWATIGVITLIGGLVMRRLRWAWGIVSDAVALETTRYPDALVRALRRLAGYNGPQVNVLPSWGGADAYWAAPVRQHFSVSTMVVNGRARTRSSTEQVADASLLLRAGIVERLGIGGDPATLASWEKAEAVFARLAYYGGDHSGDDAVDGTVHGVEITPGGAAAGALGPVNGTWQT